MNIIQNFGSITAGQLNRPRPQYGSSLYLKTSRFLTMGIMHLIRTQAACLYLFHFHKLILCGFNQIFSNHKRVFFNHNQFNINHKQQFAVNQFSQQFQPINIVHGLWTRGRIYIYIYKYIAIHFHIHTHIFIFLNQKSHQQLSNFKTLLNRNLRLFFAFTRILCICKNRIVTMLFNI